MKTTNISFKDNHPFEKRKDESNKIMIKYPNRVPIICERSGMTDIPLIDKHKYLVPTDLLIGQFMHVIRKRLKLHPSKAIFLFINNRVIPPSSITLGMVYEEHKSKDGFLYITYAGENTFG